jgi:hypothetical protein
MFGLSSQHDRSEAGLRQQLRESMGAEVGIEWHLTSGVKEVAALSIARLLI